MFGTRMETSDLSVFNLLNVLLYLFESLQDQLNLDTWRVNTWAFQSPWQCQTPTNQACSEATGLQLFLPAEIVMCKKVHWIHAALFSTYNEFPYLACLRNSSAETLDLFAEPTCLLAPAEGAWLLGTPVLGHLLQHDQPLCEAAGMPGHRAADGGVAWWAFHVDNLLVTCSATHHWGQEQSRSRHLEEVWNCYFCHQICNDSNWTLSLGNVAEKNRKKFSDLLNWGGGSLEG